MCGKGGKIKHDSHVRRESMVREMATRAAPTKGASDNHAFPFKFDASAISPWKEKKSKISHSMTSVIKQMKLSSEIKR